MSSGSRRAEFFALEASEYIGDLEPLVARSDTPDIERLVRGARALRGAALMAGLGTFARAAAGMEGIARQVRDHALGWEGPAREGWREGLQTLRALVARATTWEAADDRQSLALADRLERVAGGRTTASAAQPVTEAVATPSGMTPGVRAFIARESALIAGSLQEAAHALAPTPPPEALAGVLERMRSLRGIGTSADLSPLPELLDAMEVMTRGLITGGTPSPELAEIFSSAAEALATMARSVGDHGRVMVPPGLGEVARELLERHITPVGMLPPPESGVTPDPIPVELVGVGDHLIAQADALGRQSSPSARDLRLFVLHRTLGSMPERSGTGRFLAPLVRAVTTAIGTGGASRDPDTFTAMLREAGEFLVDAAAVSDPATLGARRDGIANAILHEQGRQGGLPAASGGHPGLAVTETWERPPREVQPATAPAANPGLANTRAWATPPADDGVVPIEALAPTEPPRPGLANTQAWATPPAADDDVVPIEALAPGEPPRPALASTQTWETPPAAADDVVPIEALAPGEPPRPGLANTQAWATPPAADDGVVPAEALAPAEPPRPGLAFTETWETPPAAADEDAVPIESLAPAEPPRPGLANTRAWATPPDPRDEVVPIESLAPLPAPEVVDRPGRLEAAFRRERELARAHGDEPPSLQGLVGEAPVEVTALLYRGEAAVARAEELRSQLTNILAEPRIALDRLRPILDELLDLVPLARDAA